MRVLVTGASGFLGKNLCLGLLARSHQVYSVSRRKLDFAHKNLTEILSDISRIDYLKDINDIDIVFHCAANIQYSENMKSFSEMMSDNVYSIEPLVKFLAKNRVKYLVYSSSSSVYQKNFNDKLLITESFPIGPKNNYAITKITSEYLLQKLCSEYGISLLILRYSSIYGPFQKVTSILPVFLHRAIAGKDIEIFGNGQRTQDYVHVGDIVDLHIKILENNKFDSSVYNIGSGELVSDIYLAEVVKKVTSSNSKIIISNTNSHEVEYFTYDISYAKASLEFSSTKLAEGLASYNAFLKEQ